MLTRLSLSASAAARAAANAPGSPPTSSHMSPPPPAATATAVEQVATSGPLVKLQQTATRIGSGTAASLAPQPAAVGLTSAAQHISVTDPATAAASELCDEETAPAAAASVSSEGNTPAAVDQRPQQADAVATAVGQVNSGAEQPAAAAKSVDSSLTSPGSFSA